MLAKVTSCAVIGLGATPVEVEVDTARGLFSLTIVGLPDAAVQESRERVRAAIVNSGFDFPGNRLTINLAPAAIRKTGPIYDLPIAIGILAATRQIPVNALDSALLVGELSLDGGARHVSGVLLVAAMAQEEGFETVYVPAADAPEAALIPGVQVIPVENLERTGAALAGHRAARVISRPDRSGGRARRIGRFLPRQRAGTRQAGVGGGRGRWT